MSATRRRWMLPAIGRDHLRMVEEPVPPLAPYQVLVKAAAVSLNFHDRIVVDMGLDYPGGSFTPCSDLAGEVVAAGAAVSRFRPGDKVISTYLPGWLDGDDLRAPRASQPGTMGGVYPGVLAEFVDIDEEWLVAAPASLDPAEAACLPCAGLTAWFALVEKGRVRAGQTVLVHGTGGVSLLAAQIALAQGAHVIVTSRSAEKLARVAQLGVQSLVDKAQGDWVTQVMAITGGRGVDHIVETIGGSHFVESLEAAAQGGQVSLVGVFGGGEISAGFRALAQKHLTIHGIGVGHRRGLEDLVRAVDVNGIRPVIDATYGFDDFRAALDHLDRGAFGKIVVTF